MEVDDVPLSISTQTEIAQTSMRCRSRDVLGKLFEEIDVVPYDTSDAGVIKLRWSRFSKGMCKKDAVHARKYPHCFENQLSFYVRCLKSKQVVFESMKNVSSRFKKTFHDAVTESRGTCYNINTEHVLLLLPPAVVQVRRVVWTKLVFDIKTTSVIAVCDGKHRTVSLAFEHFHDGQQQIVLEFERIVTIHRSLAFVFYDTRTMSSCACLMNTDLNGLNAELVYPHEISGFLFNSGKCKLAGTKAVGDSVYAVEMFYSRIRDPSAYFESLPSSSVVESLDTVLINTDTDVPFKIDRMKLYKKILTDYPKMNVFYDIDIHAAVKVRYFCNDAYDGFGQCKCSEHDSNVSTKCLGRADASGVGRCKVVTNLIYSNGKVVSTGGRTMSQSRESITFIRDLLLSSRQEIEVE